MDIRNSSVQTLRFIGNQAGTVLIRFGLTTVGDMLDLYNRHAPEEFYSIIVDTLVHYGHFPNHYLLEEMKEINDHLSRV